MKHQRNTDSPTDSLLKKANTEPEKASTRFPPPMPRSPALTAPAPPPRTSSFPRPDAPSTPGPAFPPPPARSGNATPTTPAEPEEFVERNSTRTSFAAGGERKRLIAPKGKAGPTRMKPASVAGGAPQIVAAAGVGIDHRPKTLRSPGSSFSKNDGSNPPTPPKVLGL